MRVAQHAILRAQLCRPQAQKNDAAFFVRRRRKKIKALFSKSLWRKKIEPPFCIRRWRILFFFLPCSRTKENGVPIPMHAFSRFGKRLKALSYLVFGNIFAHTSDIAKHGPQACCAARNRHRTTTYIPGVDKYICTYVPDLYVSPDT